MSHITVPRAVGELVQDLIDHAYNDGVQELERPSEQTTKALAALFAALKEPDAKREPATDKEIDAEWLKIKPVLYPMYGLGDFRDGFRAAERFHGIITKKDKP